MQPAELSAHLGKEIGVSSWIMVDQRRIDEFAQCTDDRQWIHVDVARAAEESPFGGTVAHGFLTLSLLAPTLFEIMISRVEIKQAINYGLEKVRFLAPVRAGKRVRNRVKVAALEDRSNGRILLTTENTVEIEGEDKPAVMALAQVMLMS
jgi:acyl dehydratase